MRFTSGFCNVVNQKTTNAIMKTPIFISFQSWNSSLQLRSMPEVDECHPRTQKKEFCFRLNTKPLSSSTTKLVGRSNGLPLRNGRILKRCARKMFPECVVSRACSTRWSIFRRIRFFPFAVAEVVSSCHANAHFVALFLLWRCENGSCDAQSESPFSVFPNEISLAYLFCMLILEDLITIASNFCPITAMPGEKPKFWPNAGCSKPGCTATKLVYDRFRSLSKINFYCTSWRYHKGLLRVSLKRRAPYISLARWFGGEYCLSPLPII